MQPGGIIVPGGEFDDGEIFRLAKKLEPIIHGPFADPDDIYAGMIASPFAEDNPPYNTVGMNYQSPEGLYFDFLHAPYDNKRLKEKGYRKAYSQRLLDITLRTRPDIVILANLKVVLDPVFIEGLKQAGQDKRDIPVYNLHPSSLPLLRGYRTENKAVNLRENPQAAGWTFHEVVPGLDRGATVAQQRVSVEPLDEVLMESMDDDEKKAYFIVREERLRLQAIKSESIYLPQLLELVSAKKPGTDEPLYEQKVVHGFKAFQAEGRTNFGWSEPYTQQLAKERSTGEKVDPYARVLFKVDDTWKTAEEILGIEPISDVPLTGEVQRWTIKIPKTNPKGAGALGEIFADLGGQENPLHDSSVLDQDDHWRVTLTTPVDMSPAIANIPGATVKVKAMSTRVTTKREPVHMLQDEE